MTPPPGPRVTITHVPVGHPATALAACSGRSASLAVDNYSSGVSRVDVGRWFVVITGAPIATGRWGSA